MGISRRLLVLVGTSLPLAVRLALPGQTATPGGGVVASPRPMAMEADRLQHAYGKAITYEDPVWAWRGETAPFGPNFSPVPLTFTRPADADSGTDAGTALQKTLDAYHQQTAGPKFRMETSKWGLHIIPAQVCDENGRFMPATNPLDAHVNVPQGERAATEHFIELCAALSNSLKMTIHYFDGSIYMNGTSSFEQHFAAQPARFTWGTKGMSARDAVVDLLERSATTYSWRFYCEDGPTPQARQCALNVTPVEVTKESTKKDGTRLPYNITLEWDRCPSCRPSTPGGPRKK
jgi:hypothetical protein